MSSNSQYEYYNNPSVLESWDDEEEVSESGEESEEDVKIELNPKKVRQPKQCVDEVRDTVKEQKEIVEMQTKLNWLNPKVEISSDESKYDYQGFPILGHVQRPNLSNPIPKTTKKMDESNRGIVAPKIGGFGNKSWLEERKDARVKSSYKDKFKDKKQAYGNRDSHHNDKESNDNRSAAFELLANKDSLDDKLNKTQMCNSVGKSKCHHKNCRFAHSLDELKFSNCLFGDRCRFIVVHPNGYVENSGNKKCVHKHPCENNDDFIVRTGLDRYKVVESVEQKPAVVEQKKNVSWVDKTLVKAVVKPLEVVAQKKIDVALVSSSETILRVPKNLAVQAIELAMKSGVTNIRLEIIQNS